MSPTLAIPSFSECLLKESSKPEKHRSLHWHSGGRRKLKPEVATGFAQAQLLYAACPGSAGKENQGRFHGGIGLEQSLKRETKMKGTPNSWSLHYSEITRHVIKKPGRGEGQTTDETGNGHEHREGA